MKLKARKAEPVLRFQLCQFRNASIPEGGMNRLQQGFQQGCTKQRPVESGPCAAPPALPVCSANAAGIQLPRSKRQLSIAHWFDFIAYNILSLMFVFN